MSNVFNHPPLLFVWSAWLTTLSIWVSVGTVSLVLFLLLRSRWKRTSILSRCVFISIYAPVLIAIVAVTTNILSHPVPIGRAGGRGREVRVQFTRDDEANATTTESIPTPPEPWEKPPELWNDTLAAPELLAAEAKAIDVSAPPAVAAPPLLPTVPEPQIAAAETPPTPALATVEQLLVEVAPRYAENVQEITPVVPVAQMEAAPQPAIAAKSAAASSTMPDVYRLRFQRSAAQLEAAGGSMDTEAAVNAALQWLARNQESDGRWSAARHEAGRGRLQADQDRGDTGADADTGVTALALLAFMGAGHTHLAGEHREVVQHGLEYLLSVQQRNGSLAGNAKLFASMYCHGMATFAVCEALAITRDERIRPAAERAVAYTIAAQHARGGWRYQPGDQGDMSQFGWQIMALKSAELARIPVPEDTKARARLFLESVTSGPAKGLASYRAGERATRTMTAEALLCRHLLQPAVEAAAVTEANKFLMAGLPNRQATDVYYWYYGTLALRFGGGRTWQSWNEVLQSELLASQQSSGRLAGSWHPDATWGSFGGRVYQTALSTLCLEAYYRYDTAKLEGVREGVGNILIR